MGCVGRGEVERKRGSHHLFGSGTCGIPRGPALTPFTGSGSQLRDKKRILRQRSRHLALSLDGRSSYWLYGSERILAPAQELDSGQVAAVSAARYQHVLDSIRKGVADQVGGLLWDIPEDIPIEDDDSDNEDGQAGFY